MTSRPSLAARIRLRANVERILRAYFDMRGFVEVFTPCVVQTPGLEAGLHAMEVQALQRRQHAYLHTSPEFAIKETFAHLDADVFCLARVFRDEVSSPLHSPEFTMLEWYRRKGTLESLQRDIEGIITALDETFRISKCPLAQRVQLSLQPPFATLSWHEAFRDTLGIDIHSASEDVLREALREAGVACEDHWPQEALESLAWLELLEPALGCPHPTFLEGFPLRHAALARQDPKAPHLARRFEFYLPMPLLDGPQDEDGTSWTGVELANAFEELTDAGEQRVRFERELLRRRAESNQVPPMPEDMLSGLAEMDEVAGIALGVERLCVWVAAVAYGWKTTPGDFFATRASI